MATLDRRLVTTHLPRLALSAGSRLTGDRTIAAGAVLGVLLLVGVPFLMLVFSSVRGGYGTLPFEDVAYFTADNFRDVFGQPVLLKTLRDTFFYVGGAVGLAVVVGFALAWLVERTDIPLPSAIFALIIIPFLIPQGTIVGSWVEYLRPRTGEANVWLRDVLNLGTDTGPLDPFNMQTMVLFQGFLLVPIVFLVLTATLRNANGAMEEASRTSGAAFVATVRHVTLPLLLPGLFTALVLGVWLTLDSTFVPFALGGQAEASLLNFRIWAALNPADQSFPGYGLAAAYSVVVIVGLLLLFALYAYGTRRSDRYATVTGNTMRVPRFELGTWALPAILFVVAYLALMWGLPGYRLVRGSIVAGTSGYTGLLTNATFLEALRNSAIMSIGSATLGTAVVVLVGWTVVRGRIGKWKAGLDVVATSSLVIPAAMAGVAFLLVFLTLRGLPLYGTLFGVTYALAYRMAIPYRITNAGMRQVGRDMEEVSATSGASPLTTLWRITMPLIAPVVSISWAIFFIFAVRETTLTRYLAFDDPTLVTGLRFRGLPPGSQAAATVLTILFVLGIILVVRLLLLRRARLT